MARSRGKVAVAYLHLFLHLHGAAYRPLDAIEHNEQGIASSLDDLRHHDH